MKLQRAYLLVFVLIMALTPVHAELEKRQRSRGNKEAGSVRLQMLGQRPVAKTETVVTTRGGNVTLYVAPPPTGNNGTGDGSQGAPYSTIQFAITSAISGDEIRVLPGTYNECINNTQFALGVQKNLDIIADEFLATGSRISTVIDGTNQCVFPFSAVNLAGFSSGSRLEGFTITGAAASGVFVLGSGVVTNNLITNNSSLEGGGIYAYPGTCFYGTTGITIANNQITNNTADDEGRCDVSFTVCTDSTQCPALEVCQFRGGDGGGVFVRGDVVNPAIGGCVGGDGRVTLDSNVIDGNGADFAFGGGVFVRATAESIQQSTVTITQNLISNNSTLPFSFGYGGGIWMGTYGTGTSTIDFLNNTVTSNFSTGDGGGVSAWIDADVDGSHTINLTANDIQSNVAEGSGGGMDLFVFGLDYQGTSGPIQLTADGNLIAGNQALGTSPSFYPGIGGGISANIWSQRSAVNMALNLVGNDVFSNNATLAGGGIAAISIADSDPSDNAAERDGAFTSFTVANNLVAGNVATDGATGTTAVGGGIYAYAEGLGARPPSMIGGQPNPARSEIFMNFNTVAQNASDTGSGGIELETYTELDTNGDDGAAAIEIDHSIVYDNSGFGIGGSSPPNAGILLTAGLAPVSDQGSCATSTCGTGMLGTNVDVLVATNSLFLNAGGDLESWIPDGGNMFTDPDLSASFTPGPCSDTIDAGSALVNASLEPVPNGPPGGPPVINLGHTGGTTEAVTSLADSTGDQIVDGVDLLRLSVAFASIPSDPRWDPTVDFDRDGFISGVDLALMAADFGQSCP